MKGSFPHSLPAVNEMWIGECVDKEGLDKEGIDRGDVKVGVHPPPPGTRGTPHPHTQASAEASTEGGGTLPPRIHSFIKLNLELISSGSKARTKRVHNFRETMQCLVTANQCVYTIVTMRASKKSWRYVNLTFERNVRFTEQRQRNAQNCQQSFVRKFPIEGLVCFYQHQDKDTSEMFWGYTACCMYM